jgi:hypothetical protein
MTTRLDPDQNRPESLPTTAAQVKCMRCGRVFDVIALRWDHRRGLWVCAYWPDCEGAGFHCDLHDAPPSASHVLDSQPVSLADACNLLPRRNGKKIHYSTIYRWTTKGARGKKLESMLIGGVLYTTVEALRRFLAKAPAQRTSTDNSDELRKHLYGEHRSDC